MMAFSASTVLFFLLSCGLWVAEARKYNSILAVENGGRLGYWGPVQYCSKGYAIGFQIKSQKSNQPLIVKIGGRSGSTFQSRTHNSIVCVENRGRSGYWRHVQICNKGYAIGFQIKEEPHGMEFDSTGLNAIALMCDDGEIITSASGPWGIWRNEQYCEGGKLVAFALRVQEKVKGDKTAANNIMFLCSDNTVLIGSGTQRGRFGQLSSHCKRGSICGIQTRVQSPQVDGDDTALNNVRMICCD